MKVRLLRSNKHSIQRLSFQTSAQQERSGPKIISSPQNVLKVIGEKLCRRSGKFPSGQQKEGKQIQNISTAMTSSTLAKSSIQFLFWPAEMISQMLKETSPGLRLKGWRLLMISPQLPQTSSTHLDDGPNLRIINIEWVIIFIFIFFCGDIRYGLNGLHNQHQFVRQ